jgi:regulator of protease activity HflC (stomatin/prohibitin superfamily)
VESVASGVRVVIADELTCLMMTQSAPDTPDAAEPTAEATAEATELAAEAAEDAAEAAEDAAGAGLELLELQAASAAQNPPAAITASARRGWRGRLLLASCGA